MNGRIAKLILHVDLKEQTKIKIEKLNKIEMAAQKPGFRVLRATAQHNQDDRHALPNAAALIPPCPVRLQTPTVTTQKYKLDTTTMKESIRNLHVKAFDEKREISALCGIM